MQFDITTPKPEQFKDPRSRLFPGHLTDEPRRRKGQGQDSIEYDEVKVGKKRHAEVADIELFRDSSPCDAR